MTENSQSDTENGQQADGEAQSDSSPGRARSTIEFPYVNLEEAVAIARAVHQVGGRSCEWAQVAVTLNQAPKGGAFRQKMLSARTFGLLDYKGQDVELTDLGLNVLDSGTERAAKVEAFLNVPLFSQSFDKFRDHTLPPPAAIQRQMAQMGGHDFGCPGA